MPPEQPGEPRQPSLGGVACNTRVENTVSVTILYEALLQQARPGLADFHSVGCAEAVTQDHDDRLFFLTRLCRIISKNGMGHDNGDNQQQKILETHEYL